nr:unnamed protein product [Callosobruchus analis]CAI5854651.1 unnamed protein product [Callosobruchus analis]
MGTGAQPEPDRAPGEDLVPKPTHEEQEELPTTAGAAAEQQQLRHQQPKPPRVPPSRQPSGGPYAPSYREPSRFGEWCAQAPSVTHGIFRGCAGTPPWVGRLEPQMLVQF